MFKKILFATTASPTCDHAAKVAFDLANKYGSQLYVFHAYGIPTRGFGAFSTDIRTGEQAGFDTDYTEWVKEEMRNTYAVQLAKTKNCILETRAGVPATEILRFARKEDVDLIVMGAHTREDEIGATRFRNIVGSTMQKVAKSSRAPVLIVSRPCANCFWYFSNIVFGADFSKASMSAFLFALKVAKEIGCKLYLFHSLDISKIAAGKVERQEEIEQQIETARKKIEDLYVSKMDGFDNYEVEIWEGIPYVEILKYSREKKADLIVMAHHTREVDLEEAVLGSTVEQVVLRAASPVASVNHPDKVTDVA
ncbi:MAG: universal stress protein [Desulfobacterales bacterium]|jgi:nucleotide-binding universal stress UspA family protein|nr:universal stress protein [Desulfobacterales bacterium]